MTAKSCVRIWTLTAVFMIYAQKTNAAIWEDPATIPSYAGNASFTAGGKLSGFVDYAVYAPGDYSGSVSFSSDLYVYAYQVSNNVGSTVGIDYFSVGLSPAADAPDVTYDATMTYAIAGGANPAMSSKLPESVIYMFLTDNIGAGEHTATLLFTSSFAPDWGYGYVAGGSAGGSIVELPAPVPEPASFLLIGAGILPVLRRRRKS